jgi:type II secretory pathway pseudopilin PulG
MIAIKKQNRGFTIVELLIVIVVVIVLALLVISTYSGIQSKTRDAKRQADLKSLQSQIEAFFTNNGYYPNLTDLNSPSWRSSNLKDFSPSVLVDPSSSCSPSKDKCLVGGNGEAKAYSYSATQSDGITGCDGSIGSGNDQNCAKYTLTATLENSLNGSKKYVLQNLN